MQISKIGVLNSFKSNTPVRKINTYKADTVSFTGNFQRDLSKYYDDVIRFRVNHKDAYPGYYRPNVKKLNILRGSQGHLTDLAESICMYDDIDIYKDFVIIPGIFTLANENKTKRAKEIMVPLIEDQRAKLIHLLKLRDQILRVNEGRPMSEKNKNALEKIEKEYGRIFAKNRTAVTEFLIKEMPPEKEEENAFFPEF